MRRSIGAVDEDWAIITSVEVIHAGDAELLHFVLESGAFHTEVCGGALRARQKSSGVAQDFDNVLPFSLAERALVNGRRSGDFQPQLGQRRKQGVALRENDGIAGAYFLGKIPLVARLLVTSV
jgi:hypothetical protein